MRSATGTHGMSLVFVGISFTVPLYRCFRIGPARSIVGLK